MKVQTVLGPVPVALLGITLPHEHLVIDQRQGPAGRLADLDDQAEEVARFQAAGGGCIVDVTPPELGRSPAALAELSRRTGVHVVMGTGHFTEAYLDPLTATASEDELAADMVREIEEGLDGVRCGVIGEIGLSWPHAAVEERVLRAAAQAAAATGCAVSIHPGRDRCSPARALEVVASAGGDVRRVVIGHMERTLTASQELRALAEAGCYLELDLFGHESPPMPADEVRVERILELVAAGHAERVLVSQDIAAPADLRRNGGPGYAHVLESVVAALRAHGATDELIDMLLVQNPARMLGVSCQVGEGATS
jgi:phosphotriesterase-related protein